MRVRDQRGRRERLFIGGRALYLCATAEKMSAPFRLRVFGRSGHASIPSIADNALVKAANLIERLDAFRPEPRLGPESEALLLALTGSAPNPKEALERVRAVDSYAASLLEPLLALTVSPTMIEASQKRNVIPAVCDVTVDCRLLPGQTPAEAEADLREVLGAGDYELEWLEAHGGSRSSLSSPLWDVIRSFVTELESGAEPVPCCVAGFTDSHWLREAFGTVAYGFFPARALPLEAAATLVHSADERVPIEDLELGVDFLRYAARTLSNRQ